MSGKFNGNIILLTGDPGCGKTTLVRKVHESLLANGIKMAGFYSEEIRQGGQRTGFDIVLLNEKRGPLARAESSVAGPKVGKYTVDLKSFESLLLPQLSTEVLNSSERLILDEIGKMELFSKAFESAVRRISNSSQVILATVPIRGIGLVEQLKSRVGDNLILVQKGNRDNLAADIESKLKVLMKH